ncbi:Protein kinase PINOID [Acorus gramineus]|uniref:non-specific serine/threonine protein kinase n=1 Tax=Acorus gramineus TaxID=55184 RepID=A0AAV9BEY2_ACOGR|nr:Protein kinase PINOID [Acorus gramineus]
MEAEDHLPLFTLQHSSSFTASEIAPHPHHNSDPSWTAIRSAASLTPDGHLRLRDLQVLRPLGSGNLGRVFHCRLRGSSSEFALKVVETDGDSSSSRATHAVNEARALAQLDHPFLPTLYATIATPRHTCLLIDYCPGGDLHSLLRRFRRLPTPAVRFYAAEVLLALEYLHLKGLVYRDLKPENVLRRSDGHIMLSDFDLCFKAEVVPTVVWSTTSRSRSRSQSQREVYPELVAEPVSAFSRSCVGTHEYLAPEVLTRGGYGCGIDWWAFGVFVYELLYGRTPFKGGTKGGTLRNIVSRPLVFPDMEGVDGGDWAARDLIERLLVKDPKRRLGAVKGAAEVKAHPFFEGVKWALVRWYRAPGKVGGSGERRRCGRREKGGRRRRWWWGGLKGVKLGWGSGGGGKSGCKSRLKWV